MAQKKNNMPKQRNSAAYALAVSRSGTGTHGKSKKAQRRKDTVEFKKQIRGYSE